MRAVTPILIIFHVIISKNIILEDLARDGKEFKWQKPSICPNCKVYHLWGHGFVKAYFSGYPQCLWLKRYRCSNCSCIVTIRPFGFWKNYQSSIEEIFETLRNYYKNKHWPIGSSRQKSGHWLRIFTLNIKMLLFDRFKTRDPPEVLQLCFHHDIPFLCSN